MIIGCTATFLALFLVNYMDFIERNQENSYIDWDVKTITSGDFTVEIDVEEGFYKDYKTSKEKEDWENECVEKCACCR